MNLKASNRSNSLKNKIRKKKKLFDDDQLQ